MKIGDTQYRTIWVSDDARSVYIIDQTKLPFEFVTRKLTSVEDAAEAISVMRVRGAPLIGATAAYGMCLAMSENTSDDTLDQAYEMLVATRPTAVNLRWALDEMRGHLRNRPHNERLEAAYQKAEEICDDDVDTCENIGRHALKLFESCLEKKATKGPLNILTHCNAGWLATVDWGTALSPIYQAHDKGLPVHVWVDETRPRNQGASLTAWELGSHGVPHTIIVDNAGGHLMQDGQVDLCIVGTDRTTATGDVCNKIGTYLKALAAKDNGIPFYVALPHSTIDWALENGFDIPIEQRSREEVEVITGTDEAGVLRSVRVTPQESSSANHAFDVTPARLVTALITERGVCYASRSGLLELYPERADKELR
jgi:methylthioribose-1-phosphate isomerase